MKNKAVFFFGPPGSGKGTQANLLVAANGFWHFDSGKFIEHTVHNPLLQDDEIVKRERVIFESGELNTPAWILKIVREKAQKVLASADVTFSGSMRTVFETVGSPENIGLIDGLCNISQLFFIWLEIADEIAIARNSNRLVCKNCDIPLIHIDGLVYQTCPICGSELRKRCFDNIEKMRTRLEVYKTRTVPVIDVIQSRGLVVHKINANRPPWDIHTEIIEILNRV